MILSADDRRTRMPEGIEEGVEYIVGRRSENENAASIQGQHREPRMPERGETRTVKRESKSEERKREAGRWIP